MQEILEIIPVGLFQCNCIIMADPQTKDAIVVDPGDDAKEILKKIAKHGLTVRAIYHTHTHIDHIGGTTELQKKTNARVLFHKEDLFLYENMAKQGAALGLSQSASMQPVLPDEYIREGMEVVCGAIGGEVLHTPGHTPGSCGFFFPKLREAGLLLSGDTLFAGSVGRTDLWKGNYDEEISSIKKKYLTLPDEVIVIPGHGPTTQIGTERNHNPFLV